MLLELIEVQVLRPLLPGVYLYRYVSDARSRWVEPSKRVIQNLLEKGFVHYTVSWYLNGEELYKDFIIELDYDDLRSNLRAAREIIRYLNQLGIQPTAVFSGHKSIHLRVDMSRYHQEVLLFREQLDEAFKAILEKLSTRYAIDTAVYMASRHMIRAIGSRHEETGLFCIPIELSWNEKEILKKAREPPSYIPSSSIDIAKLFEKLSLIKLGKDLYEKLYKEHKKQVNSTRLVRTLTERPCVSSRGFEYVEKVAERGLPDGRKRFILYILSRYLVNVKGLSDEEALEVIHRFIENSCRNFGNCGKIYDSWIRSVLRGVRAKGLLPYKLETLCSREEHAELCKQIVAVLDGLTIHSGMFCRAL